MGSPEVDKFQYQIIDFQGFQHYVSLNFVDFVDFVDFGCQLDRLSLYYWVESSQVLNRFVPLDYNCLI